MIHGPTPISSHRRVWRRSRPTPRLSDRISCSSFRALPMASSVSRPLWSLMHMLADFRCTRGLFGRRTHSCPPICDAGPPRALTEILRRSCCPICGPEWTDSSPTRRISACAPARCFFTSNRQAMNIELTPTEARIIGCLIEKQIMTPDQYPLSLNALVNACNQKSNREPVLDLDERTVQQTLDDLGRKHFVVEKSGFGSRVPKYQHRFCNTEYGTLKLDPQELAIVCELMLRGAQTPGELRSRAARMAPFTDVSEVEAALTRLSEREDGPFVVRLAREAGRRESRYAHLFSGEVAGGEVPGAEREAPTAADAARAATLSTPAETAFPDMRQEQRLARLEEEVRALRSELNDLRTRLGG